MIQPFTPTELDTIRAAAEAATPADYSTYNLDEYEGVITPSFHYYDDSGKMVPVAGWVLEGPKSIGNSEGCALTEADAKHLKNCSPASVMRLVEQIKQLTKQVDEYGKVMTNVVPGEHGEGEEVPATPESIRYLLKELQSEWDNAERRITKLRAELVEQARPIGWQPIETAPKDGTEIIASKNGKLFIVDWSPQNGWTTRNGNLINPDGWFPLPKPPEAK